MNTAHRGARMLHVALVLAACGILSSCINTPRPQPAADTPLPLSFGLQQRLTVAKRRFEVCTADCAPPTPKTVARIAPPARPAVLLPVPAPVTAPPATAERADSVSIQFAFASATLSPQANSQLKALRPRLRHAARIRITAYTDDRGSEGPNARLADARALAVMQRIRDELIDLDVAPQLSAVGRPLCCYVAANAAESSRALNRRAEIVIEAGRIASPVATATPAVQAQP